MDRNDLFDQILPCIEQHVDGRSELTRQRRRALVDYFHHCCCWWGDETPSIGTAVKQFTAAAILFDGAFARFSELKSNGQAVADEVAAAMTLEAVDGIWWLLHDCFETIQPLVENDDRNAVSDLIHVTMHRVFDWDNHEHRRAYVYATSDEIMNKDTRDQEQMKIIKAIGKCVEERL